MDFFFNPVSLAVIGASDHYPGEAILHNARLSEIKGSVYPVNPKRDRLGGMPCYPSVDQIPGPVDLALILTPAQTVPGALEACARKGVKGAIIESAGFAEVGETGLQLQEKCLAVARAAGMRLWGPNCMGLVDLARRRFFTFMDAKLTHSLGDPGQVGLVVQSGMLSAAFLADLATRRGMSVAKVCSIGNRCDVNECDLLEYLVGDPDCRAIALYLESLKQGRRLSELAAASAKPVVVLLGGQSKGGARAALCHTASLAGDARLAKSVLEGAGVVLARDFHHMAELANALALLKPPREKARAAVLTFSGGAGILTCDLLERHGLDLARLSDKSLAALQEFFPPWMRPGNPVDLYPAMERIGRLPAFERAAEICLEDPGVDVLIFHYALGVEDRTLDPVRLKEMADRAGKSLLFWCLGTGEAVLEFSLRAQQAGAPVFGELSLAVEALAVAADRWGGMAEASPASSASPKAPEASDPELVWDERRSKETLAAYGIPVVQEEAVTNAAQAAEAAERLGWPVVLKGVLPGVLHKTEQGLVRLGLANQAQISRAYAELRAAMGGKGQVLAQRQARHEYELIAGFLRDANFGPCLMLGLGGVLAEFMPRAAFATIPWEPKAAWDLIDRVGAARLFQGWRGAPPLDRAALVELLTGLARLAQERPDIAQVDINPVAVQEGKPFALDATIVLEGGEKNGAS